MEELFKENASVLFLVALFYAAITGLKLTARSRVSLIYAFSIMVVLFSTVDTFIALAGSFIVLFLVLEIFTEDRKLVTLFSMKYKLIDFLYRMLVEYFGWLYCLLMLLLFAMQQAEFQRVVFYYVGIVTMLILLMLVSRARFSRKSITEMVDALTRIHTINDISNLKDNKQKYDLLARMEDKHFFQRRPNQHTIPVDYALQRVVKKLMSSSASPIKNAKKVFNRGYGTIEMQLIRTIGVEFGSYSRKIRRKIFEILYANMVLNSYMQLLDKRSQARKDIRYWIIQSYIDNVSVEFGNGVVYPDAFEKKNAVKIVFEKDVQDISIEQFFVWCLGLPHYSNGVGQRAVAIHQDMIDEFGLSRAEIQSALDLVRSSKIE